jgi:hypothetical protein
LIDALLGSRRIVGSSLITLPLRISLRTVRAALRTTRDAADAGLGLLELVGELVERGASGRAPTARPAPPAPERPDGEPVPAASNGRGPARPVVPVEPAEAVEAVGPVEPVRPVDSVEPVRPVDPVDPAEPVHVDAEAEIVEEVADPGAEDGAGAQVHVAPPLHGYDALRAADVVARLRGADIAQLGAIELYEQTHRRRRTVLEAVARELKRPH